MVIRYFLNTTNVCVIYFNYKFYNNIVTNLQNNIHLLKTHFDIIDYKLYNIL